MVTKVISKCVDLVAEGRECLHLDQVADFFASEAQTRLGRQSIQGMGLLEEAEQKPHFERLRGWVRYLSEHGPISFSEVPGPEVFRIQARLNPFDELTLRQFRDLLACFLALSENPLIQGLRHPQPIPATLKPLSRQLGQLFEPDGSWRTDVSPRHQQIIRRMETARGKLEQVMSGALESYGAFLSEHVVFERNGRKTLAVKAENKGKVRGILQDYSSSGHSAFVEPFRSTPLQNELVQLDRERREELFRIRVEMSEAILAEPQIEARLCPEIVEMDAMQALATVARQTRCEPIFPNGDHELELSRARHPLLDEAFSGYRAMVSGSEDQRVMVPLNLQLNREIRGLLISGANTGGKTVALKTVGLLSLMANCGFPVPVDEGSKIPRYHTVMADIGDHQSLEGDLSTFASHLVRLRTALSLEGNRHLVLIDELGSGTDPDEGNALSQAIIECLMEKGIHLMVTTHRQVLCTFALNHEHMDNASMAFDLQRLKPTYQCLQGVPGRSHALDIAMGAGLDGVVLTRARQLLSDGAVDISAAIAELQSRARALEKEKQKLRKQELRLHRRTKDAALAQSRWESLEETFRGDRAQRLRRAVDQAEKRFRDFLRSVESRAERKRAAAEFARLQRELMLESEGPPAQEEQKSRPHESLTLKPGMQVELLSLKARGELLSLEKKQARIAVQGKVLVVDAAELKLSDSREADSKKYRVGDALDVASDNEGFSPEVNFLGYRVDDALIELDRLVDRALLCQAPFLNVVHGHGTGSLKQAIRNHLKKHDARDAFDVEIDPKNDGTTRLVFSSSG